jgi:hypothetical protein
MGGGYTRDQYGINEFVEFAAPHWSRVAGALRGFPLVGLGAAEEGVDDLHVLDGGGEGYGNFGVVEDGLGEGVALQGVLVDASGVGGGRGRGETDSFAEGGGGSSV